jgi:ribosomal protein S18 acetylase RimI-like enzyme
VKEVWERPFEIRLVTHDDLDAVLDVYRQCEDFLALGPAPVASMEMVRSDIEISQRDGGLFCGIFAPDGQMVGVVDYILGGFEGDPHSAFLSLLMIAAPYRNQGIGQAVVALIEDEIRRDPRIIAILSGVQVNNPGAVRFWEKHGYRIISGPELQPDGTTAFRLRKERSSDRGER